MPRDQFISSKLLISKLAVEIPRSAVEMEGASVAQVAYQEVPWIIVRVISDSADEKAKIISIYFLKNTKNYPEFN